MRIGVCQLPDGLSPTHTAWRDLERWVGVQHPDIALLNEMPMGAWIAGAPVFEADSAAQSVAIHESALQMLGQWPTAVIGSRPVQGRHRLANEAFLLAHGNYRPVHHKHYFPEEAGFFEATWFSIERPGFDVVEYRGVRIGALLCTELMFTEWARHYRRQGAHVIVSPRASGASMRHWHAAARMAATVSGCYVLSSNRVSAGGGPAAQFGGRGFIYSPTGELLGETSVGKPFFCASLDLDLVADAQRNYPCNVREIELPPGYPTTLNP